MRDDKEIRKIQIQKVSSSLLTLSQIFDPGAKFPRPINASVFYCFNIQKFFAPYII